jgi:tRNA A37 threonylcarbamoyladenosine dehydratase
VEALARSGVGQLDLIDNDTVSISNINRQILATHSTVGMPKVEAAKARILDINPSCVVRTHQIFYTPETADQFDFTQYDYIVDAIDTVTGKLQLVKAAQEAGTPIISCMGTGNKLDASAFEVSDISKTTMCPLARIMRKELSKRGIKHLKVVYSKEEALSPTGWEEEAKMLGKRQIPGSVAFVPGAAGLILAGEVIKDLAE